MPRHISVMDAAQRHACTSSQSVHINVHPSALNGTNILTLCHKQHRAALNNSGALLRPGASSYKQTSIICRSSNVQQFRQEFQPAGGVLPQGTVPMPDGTQQFLQPDHMQPLSKRFWRHGPSGSVRVRNPYAQHARLSPVPAHVPQPPFSFPGQEYHLVEMQRDYSKEWPRLEFRDGVPYMSMGFLSPLQDPNFAPFWIYRAVEAFKLTVKDRILQGVAAALYVAALVMAVGWLWERQPLLTAALAVNWARGSLSFLKLGLLLGFAAIDRVWLYWIFFVGNLVDKLLARIAPPVRRFMWANFTVWVLYIALSPLEWYPLPFWPFAPGSQGAIEAPWGRI